MDELNKGLQKMRKEKGIKFTETEIMKTLFCGESKAKQIGRGTYGYNVSVLEQNTLKKMLKKHGIVVK